VNNLALPTALGILCFTVYQGVEKLLYMLLKFFRFTTLVLYIVRAGSLLGLKHGVLHDLVPSLF
jgi:hypothetical protein